MRVSPRDLKAVRASGLVTRYALLGRAVFAIVDVPAAGSAGTAIEDACRLEHWGLVLSGELTLEGRRRRVFSTGTAFYVAPGPSHRLSSPSRAVIAGFAPVTEPIDDSLERLRAEGYEVLTRSAAPLLPPTSVRVDGLRTRHATTGLIETESAVMGDWLFTRSSFGPLSGHADGWCDLPHWGLVLDGDLVLRWEDGELELLGPGDAFHCPAGGPGHRIEVADAATIVDYTPIGTVDDPGLRRAPRLLAARAGTVATPPVRLADEGDRARVPA
jgi:quercetin dioxygenase-like cupin family protein